MTERIETMVPILYISVTLMAFYGPNGNLTGNVLLNLWHYQPITDIGVLLKTLGLLFGIDFMSFLVNGILLYGFFRINVVKVLAKIQKDFWFYMAFQEAFLFCIVSKKIQKLQLQ